MGTIRLATIDNHDVVRAGLTGYVAEHAPDIELVVSVADVAAYDAAVEQAGPVDVVLLDLLLSEGPSHDAIPRLRASGVRVLVYTTEERPVPLRKAVSAGAMGVLLKSDPLRTVVEGVRMAMAGEFCCSGPLAHALITDDTLFVELSEQQRQVLQCLDEGLDYRATARVLGISEGTVKTYLARIREKHRTLGWDAGNSHHLTRQAFEQGHLR